jgi:hypothetical protein
MVRVTGNLNLVRITFPELEESADELYQSAQRVANQRVEAWWSCAPGLLRWFLNAFWISVGRRWWWWCGDGESERCEECWGKSVCRRWVIQSNTLAERVPSQSEEG